MTTDPTADLFAAIESRGTRSDVAGVSLVDDPVSPMPATRPASRRSCARATEFDRSITDALLAVDPELDVFEASTLGYVDRLRERLEEDPAGRRAYSPDGFTPLHLAAFFGKHEVARILLDAGASVAAYTTNDLANQPLHAAAAGRQIELSRELVAAGADVNATQHGGYTPAP